MAKAVTFSCKICHLYTMLLNHEGIIVDCKCKRLKKLKISKYSYQEAQILLFPSFSSLESNVFKMHANIFCPKCFQLELYMEKPAETT